MARYKKGVLVKFADFSVLAIWGGGHHLLAPPKIWAVPALKVIVLHRYDELSDVSTLYIIARDLYSMLRGVPLRAAHF